MISTCDFGIYCVYIKTHLNMQLQLSSATRDPMLCLGIYHFPYFVDTTRDCTVRLA